jgi:hypothetical protein
MTSLRKKYQDYQDFQSPSNKSAPVVAATPVQAAEPPPAAEPQKPLEEIQKPSAADEAAANAIQARIAEMDRAESLAQQQAANHPRLAAEPQPPPQQQPIEQAIASLPKRAQGWYKSHPEYFTDPEGAARMQYAHWVVRRETGEEFTEKYFDRMESLLGFQQQPPAQTKTAPTQDNKVNGHAPVSAPAEPPRNPTPVRQQQQRSGPPVSAPPTRDVPSLASGRPTTRRVPLTEVELQIAKNSGISPEEYQLQKEKMLQLQAAGVIQNGGR